MENKHARRGFTLIELLVVVLIIGILAAVAVPQYQNVVEKSRVSEAYTLLDAMQKSLILYTLENGDMLARMKMFDLADTIDVKDKLEVITLEEKPWYKSSHFIYDMYCDSGYCFADAFRYMKSDTTDYREHYAFQWWNYKGGKWHKECLWKDYLGKQICNSLAEVTVKKW